MAISKALLRRVEAAERQIEPASNPLVIILSVVKPKPGCEGSNAATHPDHFYSEAKHAIIPGRSGKGRKKTVAGCTLHRADDESEQDFIKRAEAKGKEAGALVVELS